MTSRLTTATETLEAALLRGALNLPEPVVRRMAGRPVVLDGQTLDPGTQLLLRLKKVAREPDVESLPIPDGRRELVKQSRLAGGRQPIGETRDLTVDGDEGPLPARLYVPRRDSDALLVFFHGGGWIYGDLESHDAVCRFLAERAGVRVLAVDYRLAPESPFPAPYDDATGVYRWVVKNTDSLGASPDRLAVGGDSAGGALSAAVALAAAREGLPLAFQLLVYPATDLTRSSESHRLFGRGFYLTREFMDLARTSYLPPGIEETDPRASVLHDEVPPGLAPAYVCTAGFDPLRDEGEAYARKLAEAGVEVELERFPGLIHGFLNMVGVLGSARTAVSSVADHLAAGLRTPPPAR